MRRCILRPGGLLPPAIEFGVGAACFCFLCLGLPLEPQSASQKGNGADQTVLRVSTHLVEVSVVVENRKGEPVRDLGRDDFTVLDDGREEQISVFSLEREQPAPTPAQPLPSNTFSNRLEYHPGTPTSVTVVLLDGLNTHFEDQVYARAQVVKFLQQIRPGDRVALYTLGANLRVLHDFTSDAQSLLAALERYKVRESGEVGASEPPKPPASIIVITPNTGNTGGAPVTTAPAVPIEVGLEQYMRETAQRSADFYSMDRTLRTLGALEAIARRLSNIPGRKNLVWVASSFPFTIGFGTANARNVTRGERSFGPEIERAERALNNANLAIYPVDARGLVGTFADQPNLSAERSVSARAPGENAINGVGQLTPTHDTMEELADRTGGRAFYGSNDILGSIRRAVEDSRVTYTLAYYPPQNKWDGRFHEIKVKVRRSGVRVLCRRGYFALAEKPLGPSDRDAVLREAALSPLDSTALGVTVRAGADPSIPRTIDLTVEIDPRNLRLEQQNGRWTGSLDLLFAQLSAQGLILKGLAQPITLRLTGEEFEHIRRNGLSVSGRIETVAGAERLRVVARDGTSGALGSISIPLEQYIPATSRAAAAVK